MNRFLLGADRLEVIYLAVLRIIVLIFATLALIAAAIVAIDGARSLFTSTEVETAKVTVNTSDITAELAQKQKQKEAALEGREATPDWAKKSHAAFLAGPFEQYYSVYRATALRYKKPEDTIPSKTEVADGLGYTVDALVAGEDATVAAFHNDAEFAQQIVAAARQASIQPAYVQQLVRYKAAEKTAKACSTKYVPRRVWDSGSTGCDGWWQSPIGCPVIRNVPVEDCQPAYPDGIKGPNLAFAELDASFRGLWLKKSEEVQTAANAERQSRVALKESGVPKLLKAAYVFGSFLAIMFLFLVIAVERHLRRLPKEVGAP